MSTIVVSGWMLSTTPCMMPTKGSLRPKSVVKVTTRLSDMHWQSSRSGDGESRGGYVRAQSYTRAYAAVLDDTPACRFQRGIKIIGSGVGLVHRVSRAGIMAGCGKRDCEWSDTPQNLCGRG